MNTDCSSPGSCEYGWSIAQLVVENMNQQIASALKGRGGCTNFSLRSVARLALFGNDIGKEGDAGQRLNAAFTKWILSFGNQIEVQFELNEGRPARKFKVRLERARMPFPEGVPRISWHGE